MYKLRFSSGVFIVIVYCHIHHEDIFMSRRNLTHVTYVQKMT